MIAPAYALRDGNTIPAIGLGTYGLDDQAGIDAITAGIADGYRLIDTAFNYGNEEAVGEAIRRTDVDRSDLVIATKLPGKHHGFDETIASFEQSRMRLDLDWVDLYLIHWPLPRLGKYLDSWRAMISLREKGLVRSIGVSNFTAEMLTRLIDSTGIVPVVNQVELHPYFPQEELRAFHDEHDIRTMSWSPLAKRTELLQEPVIAEVAAAHGVTPAQAVLRWHIELEAVPIPKSSDAARRRENLDVFGFTLTTEEVDAISALSRGRIWGGDPDTHEEF
ncbi:diketogulonate reductase-like aldo/keto reductase [Agromyces hippuratus]|uniref:Diketogulonate reductase-like aldo/keto reductase n=1 Tax=Agromyces hippuratus TaxID=286438 RepID=A0A852X8V3_9MICO|nr:aldo/keto reductase [Agromyces hippuratus]NYG22315.1 diketogulonate reductase-like aldo/keto reductase [Agromyces hippuratus]